MIFFVANDGTIIKSLPSPVYQGGSNTNTIYLVAPFAANMQVTVVFQLSNGVRTTPALMTAQNEISGIINEKSQKEYAVWVYSLPNSITQYYGIATVQFFFYAAQAGVITATSATSFTVGRGVPAILPDTPTEDVYEQILSNLASMQEQLDNGSYAARSIYAWNNTYSYGANELVFYSNKGEYGVFLKSLVADNTTEPYTDGVLNSESWDEVVDFNILNDLYNLKSDTEQNAQNAAKSATEAAQSEGNAAQSALAAKENMDAAISAAQDAKDAADLAESFAKYGIKINTDYTSVADLPEVGNSQYIYLIPNGSTGTNSYDEWIWSDSKQGYEKIGTTEIDLSDYATKQELEDSLQIEITAREEADSALQGDIDSLKVYDLVIRTQEEFEAFYATLDDGTCEAHSVLFVGDGGALKFTRNDGKTLHLPESLYRLDGMNNAIIAVLDFTYSSTDKAAVWYTNLPTDTSHRISNLTVDTNNTSSNGCFYNCTQLTNCTGTSACISAFYACTQLTNCTGTNTGNSGSAFYTCTQLTNCTGTGTGSGSGYTTCTQLTNCTGIGNAAMAGFNSCKQLTNCTGTASATTSGRGGLGFYTCTQLTNCTGTGTSNGNAGSGYSFYSCSYCNGCKAGSTASTLGIWGGTTTKRDDDSCEI